MAQPTGLRERKRLAAMRRIQHVALQLFDQFGYTRVSIERIAAQAEVSASSVYRYFGTKERIVLWDEYDDRAVELFLAELRQQRPPVAALRQAAVHVLDTQATEDQWREQRRMHYTFTQPSIEAATIAYAHQMADAVGTLIADHTGRPHDDPDIHLFTHSMVGALFAAVRGWYRSGFEQPLRDVIDHMFDALERGFRI